MLSQHVRKRKPTSQDRSLQDIQAANLPALRLTVALRFALRFALPCTLPDVLLRFRIVSLS